MSQIASILGLSVKEARWHLVKVMERDGDVKRALGVEGDKAEKIVNLSNIRAFTER